MADARGFIGPVLWGAIGTVVLATAACGEIGIVGPGFEGWGGDSGSSTETGTSDDDVASSDGDAGGIIDAKPRRGGGAVRTGCSNTAGVGVFVGCYFDNLDFTGFAFERADARISFDWQLGAPAAGMGVDTFSVVWQGDFVLEAGDYELTASTDDGVRLYVDGALVLESWREQSAAPQTAVKTLAAGTHRVRMEYYESGWDASAQLSWAKRQTGSPGAGPAAGPELVIFPFPASGTRMRESANFAVTVNGAKVYARNASKTTDAWFAFAGEVEVRITVREPVSSYVLSPLSAGIQSSASGNVITFKLDAPRKLILHHVNAIQEVLAIWADAIPEKRPRLGDSGVVSVLAKGADGTGVTNSTAAIQSAIAGLAANGTLYFPVGVYKIRRLALKSNMSLFMEPGTILEVDHGLPTDPAEQYIITAWGCDNLRVYGHGTINANGQYYSGGGDSNRKAMTISNSGTNQRWEDLALRESQHWTWISQAPSSAGLIYNVKVLLSLDGGNRDGIDPNNWRGLLVDDAFVYSGDDSLAVSSTSAQDMALTVRNTLLWNQNSGANFKVGPTWANTSRNVHVENVDMIYAPRNISFLRANSAYGGTTNPRPEDIVFRNIRCEGARDNLLDIRGDGGVNLRFENVSVAHDRPGFFEQSGGAALDATFVNLSRRGTIALNAAEAIFIATPPSVHFARADSTIVGISAADLFADESGANSASFVLTRSGPTSAPLVVKYTVRGTAENGADYDTVQTSITIPAGSAQQTLVIRPRNDGVAEGSETVFLRLDLDPGYMVGPRFHAQAVIRDN